MAAEIERVNFARKEYRSVTSEDMAVQETHPLAIEMTYNTLIKYEGDALSFGDYILDLRKKDRNTWECFVTADYYNDLEIGQTITIQYPRFGFTAGKNFIIKRIKLDSNMMFHELALFGPE